MAYLIAVRKIALLDAYRYVSSLRTCVGPNAGFLYQLAELEAKEGFGSSVLYVKKWHGYDFNVLQRSCTLENRKSAGESRLVLSLLRPALNITCDE